MGNCFVVDTDVLIHLDYFNKRIFTSLWKQLDEMIHSGDLFSVTEVRLELNALDDRISKYWNDINKAHNFFIDPSDDETDRLPELEIFEVFQNHGKEKELWADPHLIIFGMTKNATILTQESLNSHPERKIPFVCDQLGITYMNLDEFMIHHEWEW